MGRPSVLIAHPSPDLYGADRVMLETARGFAGAGWRVVVTLPDDDGPLTALLRAEGAEIAVCPTPVLRKAYLRGLGPIRLVWQAARALGPALRLLRAVRPDVVWVNTITVPLWAPLARFSRRAVVTHAHEAEDGVPALIRRALALPMAWANVVVVNSDATGRSLAADGVGLRARLHRIYNGVDGPPEPPEQIAALPSDGPLRLLFVGRLSERKGPDVLIEMLAKLVARGHDARLELVGAVFAGYEGFEQALHDAVERHELTDRVEFSGFQPSVWNAYARSDIAFVPSRIEPLGNTAVEAMLAGVPVVVSRVQGLAEVADGGRFAALVEPDDPEALAGAVESMLADWPATQARAQLAYESALDRFAPEAYRAAVVAVGERLRAS